jgi:hypothetical protein
MPNNSETHNFYPGGIIHEEKLGKVPHGFGLILPYNVNMYAQMLSNRALRHRYFVDINIPE